MIEMKVGEWSGVELSEGYLESLPLASGSTSKYIIDLLLAIVLPGRTLCLATKPSKFLNSSAFCHPNSVPSNPTELLRILIFMLSVGLVR